MSLSTDTAMDSDDEFVILDSPATEQNNEMRKNIRNMAKQIDTLMVEMNAQARKSKTENDKLHTTVGDLMATAQANKAENDNIHIKVSNLKAMVYETCKAAETSDMQAKKLNKYVEHVDGELEETRQQLRQLSDDVKDVKRSEEACLENVDEDHVQTIQKLDKLSDDNKDLHETITALWNDNTALRAKMNSMEEKLVALISPTRDEEVNQLRARVEKLEGIKLSALIKGHATLKKIVHEIEQSVMKQEQKSNAHQAKFETTDDMLNAESVARNEMHGDLQANINSIHQASSMDIANLFDKVGLLEVRIGTAEDVEIATHQIFQRLSEQMKILDPHTTPPLAILEGLRCHPDGIILNQQGKPVGRVAKGDIARVYRRQYKCDGKGEFHRSDGAVVARAQTLTVIQSEVFMAIKARKVGEGRAVEFEGAEK